MDQTIQFISLTINALGLGVLIAGLIRMGRVFERIDSTPSKSKTFGKATT